MERTRSRSKMPKLKSAGNLKLKTVNLDLAREFHGLIPRDGLAAPVKLKKHGGHTISSWIVLHKTSEFAIFSSGLSVDLIDFRGQQISISDENGNFEIYVSELKKDGKAGKTRFSIAFEEKEERDIWLKQIQIAKEEASLIQTSFGEELLFESSLPSSEFITFASNLRLTPWKEQPMYSPPPRDPIFRSTDATGNSTSTTFSSMVKDKLTLIFTSYNLLGSFSLALGSFLAKNFEFLNSAGVQVLVATKSLTDSTTLVIEQFQKETKLSCPVFSFDPDSLGIKLRREPEDTAFSPRSEKIILNEKSPREKKALFKLTGKSNERDSDETKSTPEQMKKSGSFTETIHVVKKSESKGAIENSSSVKKSSSSGSVDPSYIKKSDSKGSVNEESTIKKSNSKGSVNEGSNIRKSDSKGAVNEGAIKKSDSKGSVESESPAPIKKSDSKGHIADNLKKSDPKNESKQISDGMKKGDSKGSVNDNIKKGDSGKAHKEKEETNLKKTDSKSVDKRERSGTPRENLQKIEKSHSKRRRQSLSVGSNDKDTVLPNPTSSPPPKKKESLTPRLERQKATLHRTNSEPSLPRNIQNARMKEMKEAATDDLTTPGSPLPEGKRPAFSLNFRKKKTISAVSSQGTDGSTTPYRLFEMNEEAHIILGHLEMGFVKIPLENIRRDLRDLIVQYNVFQKNPWITSTLYLSQPWSKEKFENVTMSIQRLQFQYASLQVDPFVKTRIPYPAQLIDNIPIYQHYFKKQSHSNILGSCHGTGPLICSVEQDVSLDKRVLMWTHLGQLQFTVPVHESQTSKSLLSFLLPKVFPGQTYNDFAYSVLNESKEEELVKLEKAMTFNTFKFGVLNFKDLNQTEADIYQNDGISSDFLEFLECLGTKVKLSTHKGFSGGLDSQKNSSGKYSYFREFHGNHVMFHVAALMPKSQIDDPRRKRFIGNDIVIIIFREGTAPFDPSLIESNFNQLFLIVSKYGNEYEVECISKHNINKFLPLSLHQKLTTSDIADFILTKCINGERSIIQNTKPFSVKMSETRKSQLNGFIHQAIPKSEGFKERLDA